MTGIFIIVGVAVACLLIFTKTGRSIGGAVVGLFVQDALKSPKAANAIYMQAIEEAQTSYSKAADTLNTLQGQLYEVTQKLKRAKNDLNTCESQCERLAKDGASDDLLILAEKRRSLKNRIETYERRIEELNPLISEATEIHKSWQLKINQLKDQKDLQVSELELSNSMSELYAKMDNLRKDSPTDKMVGRIEANVSQAKNNAAGAKITYDNQLSTQEARLNDRIASAENNDYIEGLLAKYKK
jgi:phage shock protein A